MEVESINEIGILEIKNLIELGSNNLILIDVREKEELKNGMIPTSKNIPLDELEYGLQMLEEDFKEKYGFDKPSKNKSIIFYCRTGSRAEHATKIALNLGFNAMLYRGSISEWSKIDPNVKMYNKQSGG